MACEREGHVGSEDHHVQPKFRCVYCGSWGYVPSWRSDDKEAYENCDCGLPYDECDKPCEEGET